MHNCANITAFDGGIQHRRRLWLKHQGKPEKQDRSETDMVKIKDVAEAAKVSTATVSRVLAGKSNVSSEVKERVMKTVRSLGYRPNRVARNLRSNKSSIIGLIVSDIENPFFQQVSRAVEDAALEKGYSVMLCNTDEDPKKEMMYLQLLYDENVAGVILSPSREATKDFSAISELNFPIVAIDRHVKNRAVDNIIIDNVQSAYSAVEHLITHGRRRIAGIFGSESATGQERKEGYLKALRNHNIKPQAELYKFVKPKEEGGHSFVSKLLQLKNRPDAIFTSNSLLAAGAVHALLEHEISVPEEIAIVSFDETRWSRMIVPAMTVVEQPTYDIGHTAIDLLTERIEDPQRPTREIILNTKLIVRKSCGCAPVCK